MNDPVGYLMKQAHGIESARSLPQRVGRMSLAAALSVVAMVSSVFAAPSSEDQRTLKISFESTAIVVEGVTPRAQVVLFGVERKSGVYSTRTVNVSLTIESDQTGSARHELQRSISPRSIYAAVDSVRGNFVVASPDGTVLNVRPPQALGMRGKEGLEFSAFDVDSQWIEAICVRPGHGAWRLSLMDDSSIDESPARGKLQLGAARMKALGNAEASPGKFRPHDVLIAIDPYKMTVVAMAVSE